MRGRRFFFQVIVNAYWEPLEFELPRLKLDRNGRWRRIVDTYLEPPHDFSEMATAPIIETPAYTVQPRSIAILAAEIKV